MISLFRGKIRFDRDRISFGFVKSRAFSSLFYLLVLDSDLCGTVWSVLIRLLIPNWGDIQEWTDGLLFFQISRSFHDLDHIVGKVTSVRVTGLCDVIRYGFGLGHSACMGSALTRQDVFKALFIRMWIWLVFINLSHILNVQNCIFLDSLWSR